MAFPANNTLSHVYTDGNASTSAIGITVDLVTANGEYFTAAGGETVDVVNVRRKVRSRAVPP